MIPALLLAPFGLIIPAIIRFIIIKKPLAKFAAGIITFLNLVAFITCGILVIHGIDASRVTTALSIGGAISGLISFKMLTNNSESPTENVKESQQ